ncbi:MAG: type II toxin-antitoxin system Phd/YefM family antitoxin [Microthrixaceae bacterium]
MVVGVRDLKAHLSEYLGRVRDGETLVVTDRGRPVARLVPYGADSVLERGFDEGWVEPPRRHGGLEPVTQRASASRSVLEVLAEDRG